MGKSHVDVVTVGNALIDAFLSIQKNNRFTRIDQQEKALCFEFGQKIHVDSCSFLLGGNACNVAVGLSRLGYKTVIVAEIGDDAFSKQIVQHLQNESINTSYILQSLNKSSSFAMGINYKGERTLFVHHVERKHNFSFENLSADAMYLTSLGVEWKSAYKKALKWAEQQNVKIAFSPGTHQMECFDNPQKDLAAIEILKEVLLRADILFVNKEEAQRMLGRKNSTSSLASEMREIEELLVQLQKMGPKIVSITDGVNGSYAVEKQGKLYRMNAPKCEILEKTGAGDAYASAFLSAVLKNKPITKAMEWGAINAASVMEKIGAQTGLLTRKELEEKCG